jgi:hypothetical protein
VIEVSPGTVIVTNKQSAGRLLPIIPGGVAACPGILRRHDFADACAFGAVE